MPEEALKHQEALWASGELQSHVQRPGECILIPDGHWHCTYNQGEQLTVGVGGMGGMRSEVEVLCAFGAVAELREAGEEGVGRGAQVPRHLLEAESAQRGGQGRMSMRRGSEVVLHSCGAGAGRFTTERRDEDQLPVLQCLMQLLGAWSLSSAGCC